MHATVQRLVDLLHTVVALLQHNHLMILEASHQIMSVITTGTQKVGTIITTRYCFFFRLARCTNQSGNVQRCQVQNIGQDEVEWKRGSSIATNL